jgi:hypothetical protein
VNIRAIAERVAAVIRSAAHALNPFKRSTPMSQPPVVTIAVEYPNGQAVANPGDTVTVTETVTGSNTTGQSFPITGAAEDDKTTDDASVTGEIVVNLPNLLSGSVSGQTSQGANTKWALQSSKQAGNVLTNVYTVTA